MRKIFLWATLLVSILATSLLVVSGQEAVEKVTVSVGCENHLGVINLDNPNNASVFVRVAGPGGFLATATILGGSQAAFLDLLNGLYNVTTLTGEFGQEVGTDILTVFCPEQDLQGAIIRVACEDDGGKMTLTNPNNATILAIVTGENGFNTNVTIQAGGEAVIDGLLNGGYLIVTELAATNQVIGIQCIAVICQEITLKEVQAIPQCINNTGAIHLKNHNFQDIVVNISGPNSFFASVLLTSQEVEAVNDLEDGLYILTTSTAGNNSIVIGEQNVTVDCPEDPLEVDSGCVNETGRIILTNLNLVDLNASITGPNNYSNLVLVPANETSAIDGLLDGLYTVASVAGNETLGSQDVLIDCAEEELKLELIVTSTGNCTASYECRATGFEPEAIDWDFGDGTHVFDVFNVFETHNYTQTNTYIASCSAWDAETNQTLIAFDDAYVRCEKAPICPNGNNGCPECPECPNGNNTPTCPEDVCDDATIFIQQGFPQNNTYVFICDSFCEGFFPIAFVWDFGDGETLSGPNEVWHEYTVPGNYTVRCVGTDTIRAAFGARNITIEPVVTI